MKTRKQRLRSLAAMVWLIAQASFGGITNAVPWSDAFEFYTNGMTIDGTNGWMAESAANAVVTTDTAVTALLADYTNNPASGRSYPLPTTHTSVLHVATVVSNNTESASNGVVLVDFMAIPEWMSYEPEGDSSVKFSLCVSTNGKLMIWHRDATEAPASNRWLELTASPEIPSNAWARFTIVQDNSNKMFQVCVNEGAAIDDPKGWTAGGSDPGGTWFHMVQTNPAMSQLLAKGSSTYMDDVVVSTRSLIWSGTNTTERAVNDGAVDSTILIALAWDTFSGTVGSDLVALRKLTVSGLPSNLTAVAEVTSVTNVTLTLTGAALAHEAVNSTNLVIQFEDSAFTLGSHWDVTGSRTNVQLAFLDTPILSYSRYAFEESVTNDGSLDNSSPVLITLDHGTFHGEVDEDFGLDASKLVVSNKPAGLTAGVVVVSPTQLCFRLLGQATAHAVEDNLTDLTLIFQDGAFDTVPASSVFNAGEAFSVSYINPSILTYAATVFTETVVNDGAVNGTTLTLADKDFDAVEDEDLVAAGKVTHSPLPDGLGLKILRGATTKDAVLSFTGKATAHALINSVTDLEIAFQDGAFVGGNASAVENSTLSNLQISFRDPRTLTYSGSGFVELSAGMIDNRIPVTITLSGDTLTGENGNDFVADHKITADNIPDGLSAQIIRASATQLRIQLTGVALAHTSGASVANVSFTFDDTAFTDGNAIHVVNYAKTGMTVTFLDESGFFNVVPYEEPFEAYAEGTLLDGTNGWSAMYYSDACVVTNDAVMAEDLALYLEAHTGYPVTGSHTQLLYVTDTIENVIHSEANGLVYLDFMTYPVPLQAAPESDVNMQFAFYISTNRQVVIWHRDRTGGGAENRWLTLTGGALINTSEWVRFTVAQDYTNNMFQIQVNEGDPISDAAGWSESSGGSQPGSWFHMVQTNGTMSAFRIAGVGDGYLDDVTVRTQLPGTFGLARKSGTVYLFR